MRSHTAAFIEDYQEMRSWGMTNQQIADRLRVKLPSLMRRLHRNNVDAVPETPELRQAKAQIDALIASGREFEATDVTAALSPGQRQALFNHLRGTGRARVVGFRRPNNKSHRRAVWQATTNYQERDIAS